MQVRYVYKWQMTLLNANFTSLRFFFYALWRVDWNLKAVVAFYSALGLKCAELLTKIIS